MSQPYDPVKAKAYRDSHREAFKGYAWNYRGKNQEKRLAYNRKWQKAHILNHPGYRRSTQIMCKYGLSQEEFDAMLNSQGGCCAICGTTEWNGSRPQVDHDHITGKNRGILCGNCNVALGRIKDDPKIAQGMIDYLKRFKKAGIQPKSLF